MHRDVKPGNLLVTPAGLVKVSDLGLAGFLHEGGNDPRAGKIVGTVDYLAPEKIHDASLGLCRERHLRTRLHAVLRRHRQGPVSRWYDARQGPPTLRRDPLAPRQFNPEVTDDFIDLIADMMEKTPERRIQSAAEVAARLVPWVNHANSSCRIRPPVRPRGRPPRSRPTTAKTPSKTSRPRLGANATRRRTSPGRAAGPHTVASTESQSRPPRTRGRLRLFPTPSILAKPLVASRRAASRPAGLDDRNPPLPVDRGIADLSDSSSFFAEPSSHVAPARRPGTPPSTLRWDVCARPGLLITARLLTISTFPPHFFFIFLTRTTSRIHHTA